MPSLRIALACHNLTKYGHRGVDQWNDHLGGSGISGSHSFPRGQQSPAVVPLTSRSQTGGTLPCPPDQRSARLARTIESTQKEQSVKHDKDLSIKSIHPGTKIATKQIHVKVSLIPRLLTGLGMRLYQGWWVRREDLIPPSPLPTCTPAVHTCAVGCLK